MSGEITRLVFYLRNTVLYKFSTGEYLVLDKVKERFCCITNQGKCEKMGQYILTNCTLTLFCDISYDCFIFRKNRDGTILRAGDEGIRTDLEEDYDFVTRCGLVFSDNKKLEQ